MQILKKDRQDLAKEKFTDIIMSTDCDLSSVWLEHHLDMVGVGGSSPLGRTILQAI